MYARLEKVAVLLPISFSIWFMSPVLHPNSNLRFGFGPSESNIFIRQAMLLRSMEFPWSAENWSNYPAKTSIWNTGNLINLGFNLPIWILTRIVDPALAVNLYAFLGLLLTGISAYLLLRLLDCEPLIAGTFAIVAQSLPWLRQYVQFGFSTTYYLCLPLITVLLILHYLRKRDRRYAIYLLLYLVLLAVTNPYMLIFSIFIICLSALVKFRHILLFFAKLTRAQKFRRIGVVTIGIASTYLVYRYLLRFTTSEYGTPLGVYDREFINSYGASLNDLVRPDFFHLLRPGVDNLILGDSANYVGVSILGLIVVGGTWIRLRALSINHDERTSRNESTTNEIRTLVALAVGCWWLAMKDVELLNLQIPSGGTILRNLAPGIRKFVRAGLISEGILVVLSGYIVSRISRILRSQLKRNILLITTFTVVLIDLNPTSYRRVHQDFLSISTIARALEKDPGPLLNLVEAIEPDYLPVPLSGVSIVDYAPHAFNGTSEISNYFAKLGIKYLLLPDSYADEEEWPIVIQDSVRTRVNLVEPYFRLIAKDVVYEETSLSDIEQYRISLYRINPEKTDPTENSSRLGQVIFKPQLLVERSDEQRSLVHTDWTSSRNLTLHFETFDDEKHGQVSIPEFLFTFEVSFPTSKTKEFGSLEISVNGVQSRVVSVYPNKRITVSASLHDLVQLKYSGSCIESVDLEEISHLPICFGIGEFVVEQTTN